MEGDTHDFLLATILVLLFGFPLVTLLPTWIVFRKAGLQPGLSLLMFVPWIGLLLMLMVLALKKWPAEQH